MFTRTRLAGMFAVACLGIFAGCESTSTTVIDARTGRPLANTKVMESNGKVRYTGADGTVERTPGTTARVTRSGYRSVSTEL